MRGIITLFVTLLLTCALISIIACEPVKDEGCTPEQVLKYLESMNKTANNTDAANFTPLMLPTEPLNNTPTVSPAQEGSEKVESAIPPGPIKEPQNLILKDIPTKTVYEGDLVFFPNLAASDPDGDPLTYKYTPPLDTKGRWQTKRGDAGSYRATITVSDGKSEDTQDVMILVKRRNKAPVIAVVQPVTMKEGDVLDIKPNVTDPDGDLVSVSISGFQSKLPYTTTYSDAGSYTFTINASDGELSSLMEVQVKILNSNHPPKFESLADTEMREGDLFVSNPKATDPDGDKLTFRYSLPLNSSGIWQSKRGDKGAYKINVTVSDGSAVVKASFLLLVKSANHPPVLQGVQNITIKEGEVLRPEITAKDPDGDKVTVTYSGYMSSAEKKIGFQDQGMHEVVVRAYDGTDEFKDTFFVNVQDINRAPVFNPNAFK